MLSMPRIVCPDSARNSTAQKLVPPLNRLHTDPLSETKNWQNPLISSFRRQGNHGAVFTSFTAEVRRARNFAFLERHCLHAEDRTASAPHRDVVGTAQYLDRDDAGLGKSARYRSRRRAVLRILSEGNRHQASGRRGSDCARRNRLAQGC